MKVFKFGGASVRDAEGIRNLSGILRRYETEPVLTVVSAMGKTTNKLEELTWAIYQKNPNAEIIFNDLKSYHYKIIQSLFPDQSHSVYHDVENLFLELECHFDTNIPERNYDYLYDQVVCYGELLATKIVSHYLQLNGYKNLWADARNFLITDSRYREARINWSETQNLIVHHLQPLLQKTPVITQGFIARNQTNQSTTLGREGSDYSAAIFAWALNAEDVTIWKDVAGVMNADPKKFNFAEKLESINYQDAIELAYYGASVIHPKTIQPLQQAGIPLYVRSFLNPDVTGTLVGPDVMPVALPCYILKERQCIIKIKSPDFNFIAEEHLSQIFSLMVKHRLRANLMQQSAISFTFCTDHEPMRTDSFIMELTDSGYSSELLINLELLTVYNAKSGFRKDSILQGRSVLLEQMMGDTVQYIVQ